MMDGTISNEIYNIREPTKMITIPSLKNDAGLPNSSLTIIHELQELIGGFYTTSLSSFATYDHDSMTISV